MGRMVLMLGYQGAVAAVTLTMLGCNLAPPLQIPQVEGVQRAVREPREERARTYQRCLKEALDTPQGDQDHLIRCMRSEGFGFLAVSADHRREHCVTALETAEVFPEAYCFQKIE